MNRISLSFFILILCGTVNFAQSKTSVKDASKNLNEGITDLSEQISANLEENKKRRIAVVEFVDLKGNVTDLGRYLSEKLITKLFQTKKFTVIERQQLNKVISEQKLTLTGIIDPTSAQRLGKLLGVDAIAAGSISDLSKTMEINARLIGTETGEVFSAASVEILKDEAVCNLIGGCKKPTDSVVDSGNSGNSILSIRGNLKAESNFFLFEVKECFVSGASAFCDIIVTNKDKDRTLDIYGSYYREILFGTVKGSRAFDQNNNSYLSKGAEIANGTKQNLARVTLISNIPTKLRIYFDGIDPAATKFSVLEIGFQTTGINATSVKIRNVPLERK